MRKRMKKCLAYYAELCSGELSCEEATRARKELLTQINFFQHERLVHLIITCLFALLTVLSIFFCLLTIVPLLLVLTGLFLLLLIPYIAHYYCLENGTQALYQYYDILTNRIQHLVQKYDNDKKRH